MCPTIPCLIGDQFISSIRARQTSGVNIWVKTSGTENGTEELMTLAVLANANRWARNNGLAPLGKKANKPLLAVYASGNSWLGELVRGFVFKSSATIRLRIYRKRVPCTQNSLFSMSSFSKIWNPASFSMRSLVWLVVLNISSIEPNQNPN